MGSEVRDRVAEGAALTARGGELETSLEAERMARQQAVTELTQQLSVAVESIQEEQSLRSSEDAELSHAVEMVKRTVDDSLKTCNTVEINVNRLTHDLGKRFDEEAHTRDMEVSRVLRLLTEEGEIRQEADTKIGRSLSTIEDALQDEADKRTRECRELG